jgi:hypothetical protein
MGLRQYQYELTLADKKERTPNTGLAKVAVQSSADTFVFTIATFAKIQAVICNSKTRQIKLK